MACPLPPCLLSSPHLKRRPSVRHLVVLRDVLSIFLKSSTPVSSSPCSVTSLPPLCVICVPPPNVSVSVAAAASRLITYLAQRSWRAAAAAVSGQPGVCNYPVGTVCLPATSSLFIPPVLIRPCFACRSLGSSSCHFLSAPLVSMLYIREKYSDVYEAKTHEEIAARNFPHRISLIFSFRVQLAKLL